MQSDSVLYEKVLRVVFVATCLDVEGLTLKGTALQAIRVNGEWPLVPDPMRVVMLLFTAPHVCTHGGACGEPAVAAHWHGHDPNPRFDGFYCPKHIQARARWVADVEESLRTCRYVKGEGAALRAKYASGG